MELSNCLQNRAKILSLLLFYFKTISFNYPYLQTINWCVNLKLLHLIYMPVKKIQAPFYERLSLVLVGLIALGYLVILGKEVLDPLIFGFLFAVLLLPVASFLEKKLRLPRALSSLVSILLLLAFIGSILYLVGSQISKLASDWPMLKS